MLEKHLLCAQESTSRHKKLFCCTNVLSCVHKSVILFRVQGSGFRVQSLGFRVYSLGFSVVLFTSTTPQMRTNETKKKKLAAHQALRPAARPTPVAERVSEM